MRITPHFLILQLMKILKAAGKDCKWENGTVLAHNSMYKIDTFFFCPDFESA